MEHARVITVSDRCAAGLRVDESGPLLAQALNAAGYRAIVQIVSDGETSVTAALRAALADGARVILTTGGTGVGPRDRTPEATVAVVDRTLPGVAEALRSQGMANLPHAALSRGIVGVVDATSTSPGALIANLPGSPRAVAEGIEMLLPLVGHVLEQLSGGDH